MQNTANGLSIPTHRVKLADPSTKLLTPIPHNPELLLGSNHEHTAADLHPIYTGHWRQGETRVNSLPQPSCNPAKQNNHHPHTHVPAGLGML